MNTAIRETRTAADAPAPLDQLRARRTAQRGVVRREVAERGPRAGGPGVDARVYRRGPVRTPALRYTRGAHPVRSAEEAQVGFATLALAALITAMFVIALIGLAHWRAGSIEGTAPAPAPVQVEQPTWGGAVPAR
ncbi:hypothetical protein [Nocardia puris]|uniref:Uncharacterized protein n=2 Tax=Nocardia puris TaxID=208602 RepID=A0A366E2D6_9NOCA|nr:hypothetical protein [Nocardia puris]RBO96482.1 hypothetical protein DFR74_101497 [Nocardia puris]